MVVRAVESYAVDVNISLTLLGTVQGLFPVLPCGLQSATSPVGLLQRSLLMEGESPAV
jgi:hypothetical protein